MYPFSQRAAENKNPSQSTVGLFSENFLGVPIVFFPVFSNLIYRTIFDLIPPSLNSIEEISSQSFVVLCVGVFFNNYLKLEYIF